MKKTIATIILLAVLPFAAMAQAFTIKVKLLEGTGPQLRLAYKTGDGFTIDSSRNIENGWYVFRGSTDEIKIATLTVVDKAPAATTGKTWTIPAVLSFVLTNEEIVIRGDAKRIYMADVSGGVANSEWAPIKPQQAGIMEELYMATKALYEQGDSAKKDYIKTLQAQNTSVKRQFIQTRPDAFISLYFLYTMQHSMPFDSLDAIYAGLSPRYKTTTVAKDLSERITAIKATAPGRPAIELKRKDMQGNLVTLSSLKGKYVLLDFWGSWCGPCRKSHPHLKEAYQKYRSRGFEIVGVAHERSKDLEGRRKSWLDAVKADGIGWVQVLDEDGSGEDNIVEAYGVSAFPTKILLDKEGRIITRLVGNDPKELDTALEKLMGK